MSANVIPGSFKVAICIFLIFISACISFYLGKDINWDLRNYHFYNGYVFANHIPLLKNINPAQLQTYHNPLIDVPLYYLIDWFPPAFTGILLGLVQGVNYCLVFYILFLILNVFAIPRSNWIAFLATCSTFYSAGSFSELGTCFGDNIISIFTLSSCLLILKKIIHENQYSEKSKIFLIAAAGLIAGMGTGLKLTSAIYALGLGVSLLFIEGTYIRKIRNLFLYGSGCVAGFLTTIGFWMFTLYKNFDNPFFPYFNRIFKSPYYRDFSFTDTRFLPQTLSEVLFYPFYFSYHKSKHYVSELNFVDFRFAVIYALLIIIGIKLIININNKAAVKIDQPVQSNILKMFMIFSGVSYCLWLKMFGIYRYLIPLEYLIPVLLFLLLYILFRSYKTVIVSMTAILTLLVIFTKPMDWGRLPWGTSYFGVEAPDVVKKGTVNIIVASNEPLAYLVPYFPSNVHFIRVFSNMTFPGDGTKIQEMAFERITRKEVQNFLLVKQGDQLKYELSHSGDSKGIDWSYKKILDLYSLKIDSAHVYPIPSFIDKDLMIYSLKTTNKQ